MSQFKARYPTTNEQRGMQFATSEIGNLKVCKFYTSSPGFENSGLAFRVAYDDATRSTNNKELCSFVGSMLCAVSKDLKPSVLEALKEAGIKPYFVELPSNARSHGIDEAEVTQMDWPSILVNFGCICIHLFIKKPYYVYRDFMSSCISELQKRVGIEPGIKLNVPFDLSRADAIKTMLGASLILRSTLIKFVMGNMNQGLIHGVCQYLFNVLSWSGMDEIILMNDILVDQGYTLRRHPKEAENLAEACAAIRAHPYPQFFMHLASTAELIKVDHSRFPNLIKSAEEIKFEIDDLQYESP